MNNIANLGKKPAFSKEFDTLVRSVGECKSKAEEDAIIVREVDLLKALLKNPKLDKRAEKELLIRLIYVEMLGFDASWGHARAVKACSEASLITKKVAYLASALFLDHTSSLLLLMVNTLLSDLKSDNYLVVCTALTAACKLIGPEVITAVLPTVVELLNHPKELVRKKAVMVLHRFQQLDPGHEMLTGVDLDGYFRQALCDKDPSVMSASLCGLLEVIKAKPEPYKHLVASFTSILKQVAEHRLAKSFDYHKTPAPFIQIMLLKILALLGAGDKQNSENMYHCIADCLRRANTGHTIGNAVIYEAVRTITDIYPNAVLLQTAADAIGVFLKSSSHNLKYVGIDALARIVRINPKHAVEHQMLVIDCLEDPDETLKKKTLELIFKMTKPSNVEVIVDKMIEYLRNTSDEAARADVVQRIAELAEQFAPDTTWFIDIMNQVFELGGTVTAPALADNLMRLIAEGAGTDDEAADNELRVQAANSYIDLLEKPKLPNVLLKVICWVLGEYGILAASTPAEVINRLCSIVDSQDASDEVRGYLLSAIGKICAQAGISLTPDALELLHSAKTSRNVDLQQRALEVEALLSGPGGTRAAALPHDAACEEINPDVGLSFLDGFVANAEAHGAAPYMPYELRSELGAVRMPRRADEDDDLHKLHFEAYQKPVAPSPVAAQQAVVFPDETEFGGLSIGGEQRAAPVSEEPVLRKSKAGPWGPAQYDSRPAGGVASVPTPSVAAPQAAAAEPQYSRAKEPSPDEFPSERNALRNALFGDASSSSKPQRGAVKQRAASPVKPVSRPGPVAAQGPALDLLNFGDSPPKSSAAAPANPFTQLEGLLVPQSVPAPAQPPQQSAPINPMDLFGSGPAQPAAPAYSLGGAAPGLYGAPLYSMPAQPGPAASLLGSISQPQMPVQAPGIAAVARGPAAPQPMAPRGNAAVETTKPKQDPFADLFS